jgi:hypothetical protein
MKHPEELRELAVRLVFESKRPFAHVARALQELGIHKEALRLVASWLATSMCLRGGVTTVKCGAPRGSGAGDRRAGFVCEGLQSMRPSSSGITLS